MTLVCGIPQVVQLPDVQRLEDDRDVHLDAVGVAGLTAPLTVLTRAGSKQATVAAVDLTVAVPTHVKGTHMSRFVEAMNALGPLTPAAALALARDLRTRLEAPASQVTVTFPVFVDRAAPATGLSAPHRYDVTLRAITDATEERVWVGVRAAVTSLCPCSREISDYGAHSQRGIVDVEVESPGWIDGDGIWPEELFEFADGAGSSRIYPLLKRPDERFVTMQAYDTPAFVEDIARNVVVAVRGDDRCAAWTVAVANQESIHSHEAVARVKGRR